jgi:cell division protease FtsH
MMHNPQAKLPKLLSSVPLWIMVILGLMLVVPYFLLTPAPGPIPYSAFKAHLRLGHVEHVQVSTHTIHGTLRPKNIDAPAPVQRFSTVRVEDPDFLRDLEAQRVQYRGHYESDTVQTLLLWLIPLSLLAGLYLYWTRRTDAGPGIMQFSKSRARLHIETATGVTFADVADAGEAKEELQEIVDFLHRPQKYAALGGRIPKGMLLVGLPGTGKTLLARAVAGEAGVPFFSLSGSDFVEMFAGVGAARVRDLFAQAQQRAPCIIFIDELDAVGKARSVNPVQQNDEREQTLNQLLTEMDGFDAREGIIILAATNRSEVLDPALLRAGRFDRRVVVGRPDLSGRLQIMRIHARNVRLATDVDLHVVAARTPGMVGADLANVINEAALLAARRDKRAVTMTELDDAIDRVIAGPERKSRLLVRAERRRVAYHEAGHALVAEFLPTTDPVCKVTIIPHGIAALGHTQQLPRQERYLYTKEELLDRITVLLGGRAAEEVVLRGVSTGAQDDLQRASEMARSMVTELGMSDCLGPYAVEHGPQALFLHTHDRAASVYSEAIAQCIDREAQVIVARMYQRARQLLEAQRHALEAVAQYLLQHEVIDQQTLTSLLMDLCSREQLDLVVA